MGKISKIFALLLMLLASLPLFAQNSIGDSASAVAYNFSTKFFHHGQSNLSLIILLLILAIVFIGLEAYYKTGSWHIINTFFSWNAISSESKSSTPYTITRLSLYAFIGLLLSSHVSFLSFKFLSLSTNPLLFFFLLAFLLQALLNSLSYTILKSLFSQNASAKLLLVTTLHFWASLSEIAYIFLFLMAFTKSTSLLGIYAAIWIAIFTLALVRKALIQLKIFSEAGFQLLHFILYFCTVELTPLLLVFISVKY